MSERPEAAADSAMPPNPAGDSDAALAPTKARFSIRRLAVSVLGIYVLLIVLLSFLQSKLIYYPSREIEFTPTDVGLTFEPVSLVTTDNIEIAAWYVPCEKPIAEVIFCHGNAGNIGNRVGDLKIMHHAGLAVLMFDYRGYGESQGRPTEKGTYADAEAAWRYMTKTRKIPQDRIVIFGRSLGGGVGIELASRHAPAALVVESTFTNLADVGARLFPYLPVRWMLVHRYESLDKIGRITCPKLFLHGTDDELIPLSLGRRLFDAAGEPKQFIETPGGHNSAGYTYSPDVTEQFSRFIRDAIAATESTDTAAD